MKNSMRMLRVIVWYNLEKIKTQTKKLFNK
jgi:hypothetical protein